MYSLVPNSWHHLTFQFSGSGQWSSPSVPLNTTLIELANRMKNDSIVEEEQPLADIWPYCRSHQYFRYCFLNSVLTFVVFVQNFKFQTSGNHLSSCEAMCDV